MFFFQCYFKYYINFFFFFNDTATTEIYTLSLHDALPIFRGYDHNFIVAGKPGRLGVAAEDRKSTRLNSRHDQISYAVFCLKKKIQRLPQRPCKKENKGRSSSNC